MKNYRKAKEGSDQFKGFLNSNVTVIIQLFYRVTIVKIFQTATAGKPELPGLNKTLSVFCRLLPKGFRKFIIHEFSTSL